MDSLRYMMNKDMQKREETIKSDIEKTENKIVASQAVKKAIEKQKRVQKHKEQQDKEQESFNEYLHKKREKQEWKALQSSLLESLQDRLRNWRYTGTWEARKELYDLLSAASAALKA